MRTRTASRTGFRHRNRLKTVSVPSKWINFDPHSPSLAPELDCVKITLFDYKAWR